jgi:hypothetical protein
VYVTVPYFLENKVKKEASPAEKFKIWRLPLGQLLSWSWKFLLPQISTLFVNRFV